jgi:hypothetical protein
MGIIDPHSEYTLYDIVDGSLGFEDNRPEGRIDFYGFHLSPTHDNGTYIVQYDGHAGEVGRVDSDDYGDVLELVDDLMDYVFEAHHYDYQDDKEELVEWAGKIMTDDPERERENPDLYLHIPDDAVTQTD